MKTILFFAATAVCCLALYAADGSQTGTAGSQAASLANQGRFAEAAAKFEEAIKAEPANATLYLNLGLVCRELGRYRDAVSYLEKSVELDPELNTAYYNLALIYEALAVIPDKMGFAPDQENYLRKALSCWHKVLKLENNRHKRHTAIRHIKHISMRLPK
ncbi:MAG: tetratricopeptide repeat protein [bacterium]